MCLFKLESARLRERQQRVGRAREAARRGLASAGDGLRRPQGQRMDVWKERKGTRASAREDPQNGTAQRRGAEAEGTVVARGLFLAQNSSSLDPPRSQALLVS